MSDRKTITINPELFSLSAGNTTRKKRESSGQKELKIREPSQKKQSTKTLKNKLLHYIRQTQEENYRKMHGHDPEIKPPSSRQSPTETFETDFESSLKYLSEITENASNSAANHSLANATLKNYQSVNPESLLNHMTKPSTRPSPQNPLDIPFYNTLPTPSPESPSYRIHAPSSKPSWGCLKGGSLPTYRNWKNQTQRAVPQPNISILSSPKPENHPITPIINIPKNLGGNPPEKPLIDDTQRAIINQTRAKLDQAIQVKKTELKYKKRKKTIRRTYKVGKSKTAPKIGVLISNKTIRNNISTKKQQLKQIPIEEIRKTLIKRGFIKVGSIAPNDVLRQMYESMVLVCGEVQNYNPDNLIYNFFNEKS